MSTKTYKIVYWKTWTVLYISFICFSLWQVQKQLTHGRLHCFPTQIQLCEEHIVAHLNHTFLSAIQQTALLQIKLVSAWAIPNAWATMSGRHWHAMMPTRPLRLKLSYCWISSYSPFILLQEKSGRLRIASCSGISCFLKNNSALAFFSLFQNFSAGC